MNRKLFWGVVGAVGYCAWRALRPQYDFAEKNALITGGSRGLGLVLARQLVARGARVSLIARDAHELQRAVADLTARGATVSFTVGDVGNQADIRRFVETSRRELGPVDVLINNAGIIRVAPFEEMTPSDYEEAMRTHFWAPLHTSLEVIPEMKARRKGRIVNIASFGGKVAFPHFLPYTASKFAEVGLSDGLRAELASYGIVVTTVCPGLMRTGSHWNAEFKGRNEEEYAWFAIGCGLPILSISADNAARQILRACAHGDAEVVLTIPAKLAVLARSMCPNFTARMLALVNRYILPDPGGIGTAVRKGRVSRGLVPSALTTLSDRAAVANNE